MDQVEPNFESSTFLKDVKGALDAYYYNKSDAFNPFIHQRKLKKETLPEEKKIIWKDNEEELQNFIIDPEKIDKIYYMVNYSYKGGDTYEMIARVNRGGDDDSSSPLHSPFYVEIEFSICDHDGFECNKNHHPKRGNIFVGIDAKLFAEHCLRRVNKKYKEYPIMKNALVEGGLLNDDDDKDYRCRCGCENISLKKQPRIKLIFN